MMNDFPPPLPNSVTSMDTTSYPPPPPIIFHPPNSDPTSAMQMMEKQMAEMKRFQEEQMAALEAKHQQQLAAQQKEQQKLEKKLKKIQSNSSSFASINNVTITNQTNSFSNMSSLTPAEIRTRFFNKNINMDSWFPKKPPHFTSGSNSNSNSNSNSKSKSKSTSYRTATKPTYNGVEISRRQSTRQGKGTIKPSCQAYTDQCLPCSNKVKDWGCKFCHKHEDFVLEEWEKGKNRMVLPPKKVHEGISFVKVSVRSARASHRVSHCFTCSMTLCVGVTDD